MSISWGDFEFSGGNGIRVGVDVSVETGITHSELGCTFTVDYYTDNQHTYGDTQTLSLGGSITGSITFNNNQGPGPVLRGSRTYVYSYKAAEYGSSPGKKTFSATLSGAYNGVTPSSSSTQPITARPYAAPADPSAVAATRISDSSTKVTWVRHATIAEPYYGQTVQRFVRGHGTWALLGNVSDTATSFTSSTIANRWYSFRVYAFNPAGNSALVTSNDVWTTPGAPGAPSRTPSGADQVIGWTNTCDYAQYQTQVWHAVNGVWDGAPLATVAAGVTSYTHLAPSGTVQHSYRLRAKTTSGPMLYSAYSATTSATSGATSAPSAPTGLVPTGSVVFDPSQPLQLTWTHNPTDGSAQTQYQLRHRVIGAGSWTTTSVIVSAAASYTLAAGSYSNGQSVEWQVSTWGADPAQSPYSASASVATAPTTITKLPVYLNPVSGQLEASSTPGGASYAASKVTGTTDAASMITFNHSLGVVPTLWQAWTNDVVSTTALSYYIPSSATATTVTFLVRGSGGALQPTKACTAHLLVYR